MERRCPALGPPLMAILKEAMAQALMIIYLMMPALYYFLR